MDASLSCFIKPSASILNSPPELPRSVDSFAYPTPSARRIEPYPSVYRRIEDKMSIAAATNPPHTLLSPPESPGTPHARLNAASPIRRDGDCLMADQPLLSQDEASISLDTPLFQVSEQFEPLIGKAISRNTERSRKVPPQSKPTAEEYNLFVSSAWRLFQSDPKACLRREKAYNSMYRSASRGIQKPTARSIMTAKRPIPVSRLKPRSSDPQLPIQARPPRAHRTPNIRSVSTFAGEYLTPGLSDRASPPPRPKVPAASREDSDFESVPDKCPPLDTLDRLERQDSRTKSPMAVEWKGTPLPIENEPHFDLLHPLERKLASTLRLTPAIYLCSKRRIFLEKVERTRQGKEFRKTDSQKACKIDVNKASKLWTVFNQIGWFDRKYIEPHL